jgi:HlyD family secretion protein
VQVKSAVTIPAAAIQNGSVFVVGPDSHAHKRAVTTGATSEKGLQVESGLIGGERLIVNPPADLKDGQKVQAAT